MLQRGAFYVVTDIAEEMLKLVKKKLEDPESEFIVIPHNRVHIKTELQKAGVDMDSERKSLIRTE